MVANQPNRPSHYSPSVLNQISLLPLADQASLTRTLRQTIRSKQNSLQSSAVHQKNLS